MKTMIPAMVFAAVLGGGLAFAQVPYDRIVKAENEPANWLTYAGSYKSQRYTRLDQINKQNVTQLKPAWVHQLRAAGVFETSPIVVDGVMYMTEPPSTVTALDVHTGRPLWTWTPKIPDDVIVIGSPPVNRGVAVLDNMVYAGSIAGHLAALDAKSGALRWDVVVDDNHLGYYLTLAPLALDGKIIVGVSGAENGIRGFVDAYDAKTGKRLWRRHTIPAPGEPGNDTWGGKDSWKNGGGSTWLTGSYDPELKTLYWMTGNPGPDWNGDNRPGDNLYTSSLLALNPDDGTIKWHFQFTPHDVHDWDANQNVVLFEAQVNGRERKLLGQANRNGFYYVLDRVTGEFITGTPYAKQTWADGLDAKGRPILTTNAEPTAQGALIWPNLNGGTVWFSPSYSPQTDFVYVSVREIGARYFKRVTPYRVGTFFAGGGEDELPPDDAWGAIRALQAETGELRWEIKLFSPPWAGVLSTAGGLVFSGSDEGNFYALDARTGKPLWDFQTGGAIEANPTSFM